MSLKVYAHGNCQVYFMALLLGEVEKDFIFEYGEVHKVDIDTGASAYIDKIKNADIIISQNVSASYRNEPRFSISWIEEHARKDTKIIRIPNLYFSGYQPQTIDLWGMEKFDPMPYGDVHIADLYRRGFTATQIAENLSQTGFFRRDFVKSLAFDSLCELKRRENEFHVDVIATDLILENWREKVLFHVPNHPVRWLMATFLNRILSHIGLNNAIPADGHDYFATMRQIIYPSTAFGLQLRCNVQKETKTVMTSDGLMSFEEYVNRMVQIYDSRGGQNAIMKSFYRNPSVAYYMERYLENS